MKITSKHLSIFVITVFAATSIYWIYINIKYADDVATESCLCSILSEVGKSLEQNRLEMNGISRELTRAEIEKLSIEGKMLDCQNPRDISDEVHIAIGEVNKTQTQIKIKVWRNGDDGVSSTSDDLVCPVGEAIP